MIWLSPKRGGSVAASVQRGNAVAAVLVIDDEWGVRETVRILLEHQGHTVIRAEDGRVGLQRFREHQPDIVLTDLLMPQVSGFEVIQEVKRQSPQTRVIAMSGGTLGLDLLGMAQNAGAAAVIRKPFQRQELLAATGAAKCEHPQEISARAPIQSLQQ